MKHTVQTLLSLPGTIVLPLMGWVVYGLEYANRDLAGCAGFFLAAAAAGAGLCALWRSILWPAGGLRERILVGAGLAAGLVVLGTIMATCLTGSGNVMLLAALTGGPFIVGVWNFILLFKPPALTKR